MKIAFIHYHLNPGGVTTVIRQQVRCLAEACQALVISGASAPDPDFPCPVAHVPGLDYDGTYPAHLTAGDVAAAITQAIASRWPDGCDVLHVHNPTLVKNRLLLDVLDILKERGERLFLQIHDFAEDGRPGVHTRREYPEDCHWGVINSRDYAVLTRAGLRPAGLHRIANMVTPLPLCPPAEPTAKGVLYPIRAIRRKNIGEAILLALFLPSGGHLDITLPPTGDADRKSYADWKRFCKSRRLPVRFDVGLGEPLPQLVRRSRCLVTTSITEGFGFSFLEAWTAGRLLWGRRLEEICNDFVQRGIDLSHLYTRIDVPLTWIGAGDFLRTFREAMSQAAQRLAVPLDTEALESFFETRRSRGTFDFGQFHESQQRKIIDRVRHDPRARKELIRRNPHLENPDSHGGSERLIVANRAAVLDAYSARNYRDTLEQIYDTVRRSEVRQRVDKSALAKAFLRPESFSLLKWWDYDRT